jgi:tetratricopeptide (TPR) repeat protein
MGNDDTTSSRPSKTKKKGRVKGRKYSSTESERILREAQLTSASAFEADKLYTEALELYAQVLASDPANATAWLGKGRCTAWLCNSENQNLDEAIFCLKKALEIGVSDTDLLKTTADHLGEATLTYTRDIIAGLGQKYGIAPPGSNRGPFSALFGGRKSLNPTLSEKLSEEFWGYSLPVFSSLFFCWRLSNDIKIADHVFETILALKNSGVAQNYQEAFVETFKPILFEIKTKFPKYKPPVK